MKNRVLLTITSLLLTTVMSVGQARHSQGGVKSDKSGPLTSCGSSYRLVPTDGHVGNYDYISANSTIYYWESFLAGHSYSVEVWDPYDNPGDNASLSLWSGCSTAVSTSDIQSMDPALGEGGFTDRMSWISGSSDWYQIALANGDASNGYYFYLRVTDTTLHSSRWSTWSGFGTQYAFVNETGSSISGVLTVTESGGAKHSLNVTIPANSEAFRTVQASGGDVSVGANKSGFSDFAYVGPEGAIMADAVIINASATVIEPVAFAARNYQH